MGNDTFTRQTRFRDDAGLSEVCGRVSRRHFGRAALAASAGFLLPRTSFALGSEPASRAIPSVAINVVLVHGHLPMARVGAG